MTNRMKNTSITLTAAVALASGAYALGSEAGDGSAEARKSGTGSSSATAARTAPAHFGARRAEHLEDLAKQLGVETSALRTALEELRPNRGRQGPPEEL